MIADEIRAALDAYGDDPVLARILTASFLERMERFGTVLALWGTRINLTAKPEDPAEVAFHILDFGSGAGFPGLVLASACDAQFTLAEARQKRASFLKVAAAEIGLDNTQILSARLEEKAVVPDFHAVLSRASGAPADFHAIAAGALLPEGLAILYSTPSQRLDLASARRHGLIGYRRYPYSLRRGAGRVERALAVWRKAEKVA
jgi:16S rRNA (guanine527-N7)-methyltransferase